MGKGQGQGQGDENWFKKPRQSRSHNEKELAKSKVKGDSSQTQKKNEENSGFPFSRFSYLTLTGNEDVALQLLKETLIFVLNKKNVEQQNKNENENWDHEEGQSQFFDVDIVDANGLSPLMYSALVASHSLMADLIKAGADLNKSDEDKCTPLMMLTKRGNAEDDMIRCAELLRSKVNVNEKDKNEMTALHYAVKGGHIQFARYLITQGANIQLKDELRRTPLIIAIESGNGPMVRVLLEHRGAQVQLEELTDSGLTLYEIAHMKGQQELGHLLYEIAKNESESDNLSLLSQLDQIKPQLAKVKVKEFPTAIDDERKSEVELLLDRLDLSQYAPALKESGLTFEELLLGSNDVLKKSGVDLLGHRMKIKDAIRIIHGIGWTSGSLHPIHSQSTISCEEIWSAMENIRNQIVVMGSTLKYLNNECRGQGQGSKKGKVKVDGAEEFKALSLQLSNLAAAAAQLKQNTQKFKEFLQSVDGKSGLKREDDLTELLKRNGSPGGKLSLFMVGATLTLITLTLGVKVGLRLPLPLPFRNSLST